MNDAEICYKAAEIMSERGHCKNVAEDEAGRVCFLGAVSIALSGSAWAGGETRLWDILDSAGRFLAENGIYPNDAVTYNNLPEITEEDVILLLKLTGKMLEEA